ncbi:MAG: PilZ domain-containing protein [Desulfobacterales bacterium]|nr:PilZ domain-containing protein [Desulfobacterales bacterium]
MEPERNRNKRASERKPVTTRIEFYFDSDVIEATSVNVSDTGIRFDTEAPVRVFFRMEVDGERKESLANIVWAKKKPDGGMAYGLEYVPDSEENLLINSEKI